MKLFFLVTVVAATCCGLCLFGTCDCVAQSVASFSEPGVDMASNFAAGSLGQTRLQVGIRKFFNSFVNYEHVWPRSPADPGSKIEYPFDHWFGTVGFSYGAPSWGFNMEFSCPITHTSGLKFQDSDWGQIYGVPIPVSGKTVFIDQENKLRGAVLFDVSVSLAQPASLFVIHPVLGFRFQSFSFEASDGWIRLQRPPTNRYYPGVNFDYRGTFRQYYAGAASEIQIPQSMYYRLPSCSVFIQADYAYLEYNDSEERPFSTAQSTATASGRCYHGAFKASFILAPTLSLLVDVDFKRLYGTGSRHAWRTNRSLADLFPYTRVLSDQLSLSGGVQYSF